MELVTHLRLGYALRRAHRHLQSPRWRFYHPSTVTREGYARSPAGVSDSNQGLPDLGEASTIPAPAPTQSNTLQLQPEPAVVEGSEGPDSSTESVEKSNSPPESGEQRVSTIIHSINSLDPSSLTNADYVDISHASECSLSAQNSSPVNLTLVHKRKRGAAPHTFFPYGTHGFFYVARSPCFPSMAAQLRFRITDAPTPDAFALGRDLLLRGGLPWSVSLLALLAGQEFAPLWPLLEKDGILTPKMRKQYTLLLKERRVEQPQPVIHSFYQAFHLRFSRTEAWHLWTVEQNSVQKSTLVTLFNGTHLASLARENIEEKVHVNLPKDGAVILAFEPDPRDSEGVVIRCLQIGVPLTYGEPKPDVPNVHLTFRTGALVSVADKPYVISPKMPAGNALKALFKNAARVKAETAGVVSST